MRPNYILMDTERPIYIRKDKIKQISETDMIVFDCDGVLLDVRRSYNKAVAQTTIIIIEAITGATLPLDMFDGDLNFKYKATGGFNNDWSHTYAYILRIIAELGRENIKKINETAKKSLEFEKPYDRLNFFKGKLNISLDIPGLYEKLIDFASVLDETGIISVERELNDIVGINLIQSLNFKAKVGESIISTIFEELFGGTDLFTETFGFPPTFIENEHGIVEDEQIIITQSTIDKLEELILGTRLGIASGSLSNTAKHALGVILERFPKESQIWHDVVDKYMRELGKEGLHKPNKFPLIKASDPFKPFKKSLFVGDTVADFFTARNAGDEYLFAGVYECVHNAEGAMKLFLDHGSDIVAPTVNELPMILLHVKSLNRSMNPFI